MVKPWEKHGKTPLLEGSVEVNVPKDIAKTAFSEITAIPRAAQKLISPATNSGAQAVNEYLRPIIGKEPLEKEQVTDLINQANKSAEYSPQTGAGKATRVLTDIATYMALFPEMTAASAIGAGGLAGATTSLNNDGNPLTGGAEGALAGLLTHGFIKGGSNISNKAIRNLSGIPSHIQKAATEKGSNVLAYLKFLNNGNPKTRAQELWIS